ncbi:Cyclopropane-fatty-acyl-phospholipid synthase [Pseudobythopirellula maris]|uniref:Cyclopropane-fatty-acyl-phospholipid synthase n=2 Tax=Pseudobythopirellula maris TaxID=2527991 RepID=A0A5C5ZKD2_9BACT|nr:Cyclopropane-fatty-acyl-phospholipid synthase [Pseudobythopirellula maris]
MIERGSLLVRDAGGERAFGEKGRGGEIEVHHPRFYRRIALGGSLGAAESYIDGDWDSPDLTQTLRVLAANLDALQGVERGAPVLRKPLLAVGHWLRRNTPSGSRRNISRHYDLSNELFELMLDPTMTYSCGVFPAAESSLEEASQEKYDRICRKLRLRPEDHVLEIGTGWGGFAEHAVKNYGCRITTTTISREQHGYAARRFSRAGIADRVELLLEDYRRLTGRYDKLVSIEMIEAVGERYLPTYFSACSKLLRPEGAMLLQAITIPDCRYDTYRRGVDFIQRHVFPGGFLPSPSAITGCLKRKTDFRLAHVEDFASHYARTLAAWRNNLWGRIAEVQALGFDERFLRLWAYYLAYCEAGFSENQIGVSQWLFTKPRSHLAPVLA